jgi:TPR repeat protein
MFHQTSIPWTKDSNRSQFFYGSQYFSAVPQSYQAQTAERIAQIATDESHPLPLRAHATLELGICILSGFGVDRDIDTGLEWVLAAANGGSPKARAVSRRLHRSYGRPYVEHEEDISWLIGEAMAGSHWYVASPHCFFFFPLPVLRVLVAPS